MKQHIGVRLGQRLACALVGVACLMPSLRAQASDQDKVEAGNMALGPLVMANVPATRPAIAPAMTTLAPPEAALFDMGAAAARYRAFVGEARRLTSLRALSRENVEGALIMTARLSATELSEGAAAYGVMAAAAYPPFAASLQTARDLLGPDVVVERLTQDPDGFLRQIAGARQAALIGSGVMADSLAALDRAGHYLGEAAYGVQKEAWSQQEIDPQMLLAAYRAAATSPVSLAALTSTDMPEQAADTPLPSRLIVAAAFHALGEDGRATRLIARPAGRMCMTRAQLNVRQCLAASRYPYEHVFCLARHSFEESASCLHDTMR